MDIQNLVPVDYSNQRVLTTAQVADVFETTPYRIRDNFRYAKKHFVEGRDYFKVEGEDLKALKGMLSDVGNSHSAAPIPQSANSVILYTEQGVARHCKMLNTPKALERFAELKRDYFQVAETPAVTPSVVEVQDKIGYVDKENVAWLNAEFVARELGFVEEKVNRVATSCDSHPSYVRWRTVNNYLREFGYEEQVGKGDYLPENMVYRLAMKANSETAVNFQIKIANEIMPSIRKYGCYSVKGEMSLFPDEPTAQKKLRRPAPECALVYAVLLSNLLVKIGLSSDFNRRLKELRKETHCDILEWATTTMLPFLDAVKFEKSCKDKFFANNVGGEFFNAPFAEVKAALQASPAAEVALKSSPVEKLLAMANMVAAPDAKDKLILQAAALLCK